MTLQLRRGNTASRMATTLQAGEPGWDTEEEALYIGDGTTAGGIAVGGSGGGSEVVTVTGPAAPTGMANQLGFAENAIPGTLAAAAALFTDAVVSQAGITGGTFNVDRNSLDFQAATTVFRAAPTAGSILQFPNFVRGPVFFDFGAMGPESNIMSATVSGSTLTVVFNTAPAGPFAPVVGNIVTSGDLGNNYAIVTSFSGTTLMANIPNPAARNNSNWDANSFMAWQMLTYTTTFDVNVETVDTSTPGLTRVIGMGADASDPSGVENNLAGFAHLLHARLRVRGVTVTQGIQIWNTTSNTWVSAEGPPVATPVTGLMAPTGTSLGEIGFAAAGIPARSDGTTIASGTTMDVDANNQFFISEVNMMNGTITLGANFGDTNLNSIGFPERAVTTGTVLFFPMAAGGGAAATVASVSGLVITLQGGIPGTVNPTPAGIGQIDFGVAASPPGLYVWDGAAWIR